MYQVTVENIGKVYDGDSREEAHEDFLLYRRRSILNMGRGAQEDVTLFEGDNIRAEHSGGCPTTADVKDALEWAGHTGWDAAPVAGGLQKGCWLLTWRTVDERWCEFTLASGPVVRSGAYLATMLEQVKKELNRLLADL